MQQREKQLCRNPWANPEISKYIVYMKHEEALQMISRKRLPLAKNCFGQRNHLNINIKHKNKTPPLDQDFDLIWLGGTMDPPHGRPSVRSVRPPQCVPPPQRISPPRGGVARRATALSAAPARVARGVWPGGSKRQSSKVHMELS